MATDDATKMSPAERLALAGQVAPVLRRRAGSGRKITTVDRDGKPVRVIDDVELARSILKRSEIEFSVANGKRPKVINCACGAVVPVKRKAAIPKQCRTCKTRGGAQCAGCGGTISKASAFTAKKKGREPRCRKCFAKSLKGRQVKQLLKVSTAKKNKAAEDAKKDAKCRVCGKGLRVQSVARASVSRREYPDGRRCKACAREAAIETWRDPARLARASECGKRSGEIRRARSSPAHHLA